jgi:hypothetical protein
MRAASISAAHHQQVAFAGGHEHHTDHHRHFVAAEGGQHLDRVLHVAVAPLRALHHHHQVRQPVRVHRRARDDEVAHRAVGQARQHQRRALVCADADTGQDRHVARQLVADFHAGPHRRVRLVQAHRGGDARVARAVRDLAHQQALVRGHLLGHAAVDHRDFDLVRAREHRQRQLVRQQHANGFMRRAVGMAGAAAGGLQAVHREPVVSGAHQQLRLAQPRLEGVLHQPQAHCERLQLTQAAAGLVAPVELVAQGFLERRMGGGRNQRTGGTHGESV